MTLSTQQLNIGLAICGLALLVIPLAWPKLIFNEHPTKWYKKFNWGVILLVLLSVGAYYLSNKKDQQNDEAQRNYLNTIEHMTDTLKSVKKALNQSDLSWDERTNRILHKLDSTQIIYKDTSFGNTTVSLWNTQALKFTPTGTPNQYDLVISFASSSNTVVDFRFSGCLILMSNTSDNDKIYHLRENRAANDFVKSQAANIYSTINLEGFSISQDSILLFIKYDWKNKQVKSSGPERRLLVYNARRGFFGIYNEIALRPGIKEYMVKKGFY